MLAGVTGAPADDVGPVRGALSEGLRAAGAWSGAVLLTGSWLSAALTPGATGPHLVLHASGALIAAGGGVLLAARPSRRLRPVQVAVAVLLLTAAVAVVLAAVAPAARPASTAAFPVTAAKLAVIAFASSAGRRRAPLITCSVLLAAVEAVCLVLGPGAGLRWSLDVPPLAVLLLVAAITLGFRGVLARLTDSRRAAADAAAADALTRTRAIARSRAAAVVHDGVLGDLAALASTLQLLASPDWGSADATGPVTLPGNAVLSAVRRAERAGLSVRMDGEPGQLRGLDPRVEQALGQAVEQCLSNTRRHSGSLQAEVTVLSDREGVSVMVADAGAGFEPDRVDRDRLGLATSVTARLAAVGGAARIFARPGVGTTVLLTVPRGTP